MIRASDGFARSFRLERNLERGHAPGQVAPDRSDTDAHRLSGLLLRQAHAITQNDGLALPVRKSAQRGDLRIVVADARMPAAWRTRHRLRGVMAVGGPAPTDGPRPVHHYLTQVDARLLRIAQAAPSVLHGVE